jgi:hypothetical protein
MGPLTGVLRPLRHFEPRARCRSVRMPCAHGNALSNSYGRHRRVITMQLRQPGRGEGLSHWGISTEALPTPTPRSKLSWAVFLPLVFAANVVVAVFAWFLVEWATR